MMRTVMCLVSLLVASGCVQPVHTKPGVIFSATAPSARVAVPEPGCNTRELVTEFLTTQYAERPTAVGMSGPGVIELWRDPIADTFSVTYSVKTPTGTYTCLLASGIGWRQIRPTHPSI